MRTHFNDDTISSANDDNLSVLGEHCAEDGEEGAEGAVLVMPLVVGDDGKALELAVDPGTGGK